MTRTDWSVWALAAAVAVALTPLGARRAAAQDDDVFEDEIIPKNAQPVVGVRITEDSWKQVTGRKQMGTISVSSHDILEVVYFDAPRSYALGIRRVKQGYYGKAISESFEPVLKKISRFRKVADRPWAEQYCLYYLGLAHLRRADTGKGDPAKARKYFQQLVQSIPDSRFVFDAMMGIGESWSVERRYEEAGKAFEEAQRKFDAMGKSSGVTSELRAHIKKRALTAELRRVEMLDAQKKWHEAKSAYDRLATSARGYPDIQAMARVGSVRALVASQNYELAIRNCREMISLGEQEGQTEYLAGAYMALADCYFERAGEDATPEDLVQARWNYLRVATLYFTEPSLLPKARYRAGRCYEKLATTSRRADGPKGIELARRQYKLVVERFKDSVWATQAKNRLAALKKSG